MRDLEMAARAIGHMGEGQEVLGPIEIRDPGLADIKPVEVESIRPAAPDQRVGSAIRHEQVVAGGGATVL